MHSSTRRTVRWALGAVVVLAPAAAAYERGTNRVDGDADGDGDTVEVAPSEPGPELPEDVGDGCGPAALTDAADLDASRTVARCAAGFPEPQQLGETAQLRVAVTSGVKPRRRSCSPTAWRSSTPRGWRSRSWSCRPARRSQRWRPATWTRWRGPVDAPLFDAAHGGTGVRWVLGGTLSTAPGDTDVPEAGLW